MSKQVFPDRQSLIEGAAGYITNLATKAIAERGRFTLALSGGNTPRPVYERLADRPSEESIDWTRVHIFFGDERCVPPDDERSNYYMARAALLDRVPLVASNVHRMHGEESPEKAAAEYTAELENTFGGKS